MKEITIRPRGILTETLPCEVPIPVPKTLIFDLCRMSEDVPLRVMTAKDRNLLWYY